MRFSSLYFGSGLVLFIFVNSRKCIQCQEIIKYANISLSKCMSGKNMITIACDECCIVCVFTNKECLPSLACTRRQLLVGTTHARCNEWKSRNVFVRSIVYSNQFYYTRVCGEPQISTDSRFAKIRYSHFISCQNILQQFNEHFPVLQINTHLESISSEKRVKSKSELMPYFI